MEGSLIVGNLTTRPQNPKPSLRSSGLSKSLEIVRAGEGNLDGVLAVLEAAAEWLVTKGIVGPWRPGFFSRQAFADQIAHSEVYASKLGGETVGTITLQWSDELFWPGTSSDAGMCTSWLFGRHIEEGGSGYRCLTGLARPPSSPARNFSGSIAWPEMQSFEITMRRPGSFT